MLARNLFAIAVSVVALAFVGVLVKEEGLGKRDSQPLVGTWKLINEQTILSDGTVISNRDSSAPIGFLVYDASGHVASQLFRPNTTTTAASSNLDRLRGANVGLEYEGYFGTYTVDLVNQTITRHVDAALPSESTGKDIAEQFSIVGGRLTTRSRTSGPDATPATHVLLWTRLD